MVPPSPLGGYYRARRRFPDFREQGSVTGGLLSRGEAAPRPPRKGQYMRFKDDLIHGQFNRLRRKSPALKNILVIADMEAQHRFQKDLLITSIERYTRIDGSNDTGVHALFRAADVRIERGRDQIIDIETWEAVELATYLNRVFRYGRKISRPWESSKVAHVRLASEGHHPGGTSQDHLHIQVPRTTDWR